MSSVRQRQIISVADYLEGEKSARRKHEYVWGEVYAMVGGTVAHSRIGSNIQGELFAQLKESLCEVFGSNAKIKISSNRGTQFYYPDVSVICDSNPDSELFQEQPRVVIEVLSRSTRRLDLGAKKDGYLSIPSLDTYVCVEQSSKLAIVFQRNAMGSFDELEYEGDQAMVPLPSVDCQLRFSDIYRDVELIQEFDEDDL